MAENEMMTQKAIFIYSEEMMKYKFAEDHPFNPIRIKLTYDLLKASEAIDDTQLRKPKPATEKDLLLAHSKEYIEFIESVNDGNIDEDSLLDHGLADDDMPVFESMHQASSLAVGATLQAANKVMQGHASHALNLSGGLHHAFYGKASGFCIYNDIAVAIKHITQNYGAKVLYVDTDAHHGDGVQWAFYDDPQVCTLSIHETGRYLFPGTGNITERGEGKGMGYTFNIPVDAFTEDDSWYACYEQALERVAESFKPDIIVTQNGADGHYYDPLSHLYLTMDTYKKIPTLAHRFAHEYCEGKWIALGGGGYDIFRVVPRAWALVWMEMNEHNKDLTDIPKEWIDKWQPHSKLALPLYWDDPIDMYPPVPRKEEIDYKNQSTLKNALYILRNKPIGNRFLQDTE